MESRRSSVLTMAHNSAATSSRSSQRNGTSTTSSVPHAIQEAMDKAESAVKIIKGLLTRAKYSGQDPYLALLAYRSTPVDSHLRSPAEMLYQHTIRTTVPQRIRNKDPQAHQDMERLNDRATLSTSYHDRHSRTKATLLCWTDCFSSKRCQDTLVACHHHSTS